MRSERRHDSEEVDMKTRVMAIVIIALLAAPSGSGSDPQTPATDEEPQPGTPQEQGQEPQQPSEDELEEFVPSEEVSPDLSISFPVDI